MTALAAAHPDSVSLFGSVDIPADDVRFGALGQALSGRRLQDSLGRLSEEVGMNLLREAVARAWPGDEAKQATLVTFLERQIGLEMRERVAISARDRGIDSLRAAARVLDDLANDSARAQQLVDTRAYLRASRSAHVAENTELASALDAGLGDSSAPGFPTRLRARAAALREEAFALERVPAHELSAYMDHTGWLPLAGFLLDSWAGAFRHHDPRDGEVRSVFASEFFRSEMFPSLVVAAALDPAGSVRIANVPVRGAVDCAVDVLAARYAAAVARAQAHEETAVPRDE